MEHENSLTRHNQEIGTEINFNFMINLKDTSVGSKNNSPSTFTVVE